MGDVIDAAEGPARAAPGPARRRGIGPAERARRRAQADAMILLLCAGVILASVVLTPSTTQLSLGGVEVPPLCLFKRVTGHDCFGCGLSRSFTYLGHGRIASAFGMHRLGPLLYLVVLAQIPWRARLLWAWWRGRAA